MEHQRKPQKKCKFEGNIQPLTSVGRGLVCFNNDAGGIKYLLKNVDTICVSWYILKYDLKIYFLRNYNNYILYMELYICRLAYRK